MAEGALDVVGSAIAVQTSSLVESEMKERVTLMYSSALFSGISSQECTPVAASCRARVFPRQETIFVEGRPTRKILLIKSGCVKLTQLSHDGSEVILRLSGAGDVVGVLGLSANHNHTCSAHVIETCHALVWDSARFETFLERFPRMRKNVVGILSARLHELEERFREVATQQVRMRVAHELLRLLKQIGKPLHGGIEVSLSREELAQMTGTTLFTVSRLISQWEQLGFVSPRREAVLVRDPQSLSEACSGS